MNNSWVEKYRPDKLDEISAQSNVVNSLKNALISKNIPHLLFFGPSGCGKTSTILALAKELFKHQFKDRVIEMNASDERGINIIREKVKRFAKYAANDTNPPWKLIILDEADTMTNDSQFALRRIMEQYSKVTRFCIICNYHHKIIDPIISRCSLFRFKPVSHDDMTKRMNIIALREGWTVSKDLLLKVQDISRGDMRKAINLLQKCYVNPLKYNDILDEISGLIPDNLFENLINFIIEKDLINIDKIVNDLFNQGYSLVNQIIKFHSYILNTDKIKDELKPKILIKLAEVDQSLIKGSDEYIQFIKFIYFIIVNI